MHHFLCQCTMVYAMVHQKVHSEGVDFGKTVFRSKILESRPFRAKLFFSINHFVCYLLYGAPLVHCLLKCAQEEWLALMMLNGFFEIPTVFFGFLDRWILHSYDGTKCKQHCATFTHMLCLFYASEQLNL
jgi:hypothetical protein